MPGPPLRSESVVLDVVVRLVYLPILAFGVQLLLAGHNSPGGGFIGGLVVVVGLVVRAIVQVDPIRTRFPMRGEQLMGFGLILAIVTALVPIATDNALFDHASREITLPLLGTAKVTSALAFDTGVFFVVIGVGVLMLDVFVRDAGSRDRNDIDELGETRR